MLIPINKTTVVNTDHIIRMVEIRGQNFTAVNIFFSDGHEERVFISLKEFMNRIEKCTLNSGNNT